MARFSHEIIQTPRSDHSLLKYTTLNKITNFLREFVKKKLYSQKIFLWLEKKLEEKFYDMIIRENKNKINKSKLFQIHSFIRLLFYFLYF